jgi:hypothetical protein
VNGATTLKRMAMAMALDVPVAVARRFTREAVVVVKAGGILLHDGPAENLLAAADAPRLFDPVDLGDAAVTVTIRKPPDVPVPRGVAIVLWFVSGRVEQVSDYTIEPWSVW